MTERQSGQQSDGIDSVTSTTATPAPVRIRRTPCVVDAALQIPLQLVNHFGRWQEANFPSCMQRQNLPAGNGEVIPQCG